MKEYSIGTKCVQAGYAAGNGEPRQIPIIQSTTFKYATSPTVAGRMSVNALVFLSFSVMAPIKNAASTKPKRNPKPGLKMYVGPPPAANTGTPTSPMHLVHRNKKTVRKGTI